MKYCCPHIPSLRKAFLVRAQRGGEVLASLQLSRPVSDVHSLRRRVVSQDACQLSLWSGHW